MKMENFHELEWAYNGTPIPEEDKLSFYYSFSNLDIKAKDILLCHLNEIDPDLIDLIDEDEELTEQNQFEQIIDPRNNEIIEYLTLDFSDQARFQRRNFIFKNFSQASTLNIEEHKSCIRYLCAKQDKKLPKVEDVKNFEDTKERRENEYKVYIEFVKNYVLANPSNSFKELEILYRNNLKYFTEKLNQFPNQIFSLQTALPILGNISSDSKISFDCSLAKREGSFPRYKEFTDLHKIRFNLKNYLNNLSEFITHPLFSLENQDNLNYDLKISEEALLLLLETSNNLSNEFEIPFEIGNNSIEITQPLPSRFSNLKTNLNVFEILFRNFLSCHHAQSFIEYNNGKCFSYLNNENDEIDAVDLNQIYKPKILEEFLIIDDGKLKSSILNSKLVLSGPDKNLNVIITFKNVGFLNNDNEMINLSCKLQYKRKFGLEKMTLNELLTEYVRANFIPNISTIRHHIDVDTFELIHSSNITKAEIFNEILELYQINMINLINKFYEFINMLKNFPEGKYILRYEQKFKDKFIIYNQKNLEENSKTLSIKSLFETSGLIVENDFITIDTNTCIRYMHERLRTAPGCFPSWCKKKGPTISNDREKIVKKAQTKKLEMQKELESKRKKRKRASKKVKRIQKRKQKCANENLDDLMVEEDLNYANQLIEKYARNVNTINDSSDYISLKQNTEAKVVEVKEDFCLQKYLSDAAGPSGTQNNFTREDYLEIKKAKNTKILNSSEIELRKAK